jgi:hypothetical protein
VVRKDGKLGGFSASGGPGLKKKLLQLERAHLTGKKGAKKNPREGKKDEKGFVDRFGSLC